MRIHTLGTSHGDSTFNRFNTSTLYETKNGTLYLIDAGEPVEALIRRKGLNIADVRATFISHMHQDHMGGLPGVFKNVVKYASRRNQKFTLFLPEERGTEPFKSFISSMRINAEHECLEYKTVFDGEIYEDENIVVTAIRTKHLHTLSDFDGEPCSFAFVLHFKDENIDVLHTGDLNASLEDYPEIAYEKEFDVCVCEATHYKPEVGAEKFKKSKFKKLILNHVFEAWHIRVGIAWNVENGERDLLEYYKDVPYPVFIAHDGDEYFI